MNFLTRYTPVYMYIHKYPTRMNGLPDYYSPIPMQFTRVSVGSVVVL